MGLFGMTLELVGRKNYCPAENEKKKITFEIFTDIGINRSFNNEN